MHQSSTIIQNEEKISIGNFFAVLSIFIYREELPVYAEIQLGNIPEEEDVVHADDGTKYIVRSDKSCYKCEPIKWRIPSINEDGTDAFVMADQVLNITQYYRDGSVEITWEKSDAREWLNDTFMKTAFPKQK